MGEYEVIKLVPSSWRFVNNRWSTTLLLFGGKWHSGSRNTPTLIALGRESCPVLEHAHTHTHIWLSQRVTQANTHTHKIWVLSHHFTRDLNQLYMNSDDFFIKGKLQINPSCVVFLLIISISYYNTVHTKLGHSSITNKKHDASRNMQSNDQTGFKESCRIDRENKGNW